MRKKAGPGFTKGSLGKMMPRGKGTEKRTLCLAFADPYWGLPLGVLPGITPGVIAFLAYDCGKEGFQVS